VVPSESPRPMHSYQSLRAQRTGCPACEDTVELVSRVACPASDVIVLDMKAPEIARRTKRLGIRSVPAVVINGDLAIAVPGAVLTSRR
jgi:glutaredoxin 3